MIARLRVRSMVALLLALCWAGSLRAEKSAAASVQAPHLTVSLLVPPASIYRGQKFSAGLEFEMEPGWHVYWSNAGDSGEPPAIRWKLPQGVSGGTLQFPAPRRLPLGPLMDFGYEGQVVFPIPMQTSADFKPSGRTADFGGHVTWLVCREVCIPGKADLAVSRPVAPTAPADAKSDAAAQNLIAIFESRIPQPLPSGDSAHFRTTAKGYLLDLTGTRSRSAQFFPLDQNVITNAAPQPAKDLSDGVQLALTKDPTAAAAPRNLNGVVELSDGKAYEIHAGLAAAPPAAAASSSGPVGPVARAAALAFFGGILLNLMPCVFPVLFIKGLALVQSSQHERGRLRAHGWVYTLGILVSFWAVVSLLVGLRAAGQQLGWGFQFQSPTFVALMAMLLFFLGLALAGQFEIGLSLTSAGGSLAARQGFAGSFFTGVLAMVVATPCTAPLMGPAIGYALAHSAVVSLVVFTALGLGLAAPYLLLAYNPGWTRLLPKPGAWMELLKQAVSVPIFATVIWLVWVFTLAAGSTALPGLLAAFLLLAIAGWVLGRWPGRGSAAVGAAVVVVLAIAIPVWAIRNLASPPESARAGSGNAASRADWQPFTPARLEEYRAQGRPVFVDFTASWCLSCQVNERVILDRADVQQQLRQSGVALLRADWTHEDPDITKALAALGRSGVPTYAVYPGDPAAPALVLPEVLTPGVVLHALDALPKTQPQSASLGNTLAGRR